MDTTVLNEWYQAVSAFETELRKELGVDTFAGADAKPAPPPPALDGWAEQLSYVPDEETQQAILARDAVFQRIGYEGAGPINLDLYKVEVTDPNFPNGSTVANARWAIVAERINFPALMDTALSYFSPYQADWGADAAFANTENEHLEGAILHISIPILSTKSRDLLYDDGAVAVVLSEPLRWRVSTVWTWRDHDHPVSGYREWGAYDNSQGGFTMYCRGADQATGLGILGGNSVFGPADKLWLSWQEHLVKYLTSLGLKAHVGEAVSARYTWESVKDAYYKPTGHWI